MLSLINLYPITLMQWHIRNTSNPIIERHDTRKNNNIDVKKALFVRLSIICRIIMNASSKEEWRKEYYYFKKAVIPNTKKLVQKICYICLAKSVSHR